MVLVAVLLPGFLYGRGMRRWTAEPRLMKPWQPYFFYVGLTVVFVALSSPIDALADDLFLMHMVQHLLMLMVAPTLILLGAPTTPVLLGMPRAVRRKMICLFTSLISQLSFANSQLSISQVFVLP